jgi:3-demethoxyubiquinol 3-hydroxylase
MRRADHESVEAFLHKSYTLSICATRKEMNLTSLDTLISAADTALRTLCGTHHASRPVPAAETALASDGMASSLSDAERKLSGALMRVNHVGEVCAQALYSAQALSTPDEELRQHFEHAAREETDHLAWTEKRLQELGSRKSWLNPLWYAGAFGIGLIAGRAGRAISLGFVVETERQVEQHLEQHLSRLPERDHASRAVVQQMKEDESRHADKALRAGAAALPLPVQLLMRTASKVMTGTAHHI